MSRGVFLTLGYLGLCWAYGRGYRAGCHKTEVDFANHLHLIGAG